MCFEMGHSAGCLCGGPKPMPKPQADVIIIEDSQDIGELVRQINEMYDEASELLCDECEMPVQHHGLCARCVDDGRKL